MSNTKDTPMDYKQFEGHTPGSWEIDDDEQGILYTHDTGLKFHICLIGSGGSTTMTDEEEVANLTLIAAAPDLLKENQELKLELQKQKEEIEQLRAVIEKLLLSAGYALHESLIDEAKKLIYK